MYTYLRQTALDRYFNIIGVLVIGILQKIFGNRRQDSGLNSTLAHFSYTLDILLIWRIG